MNLKKASLLALAGIAIAGQSAKADTTNYTDGDLLLTFRQAGNSYDYLVDLGQASALPSSGSTTFSIGSIATDLSSIFGSNWRTATGSSTVYIGIIGSDATNGNGYLYVGSPTSTAWNTLNGGLTNTAFSNVSQVTGDYSNGSSTANSSVALKEATSNPFSYASYQGPSGTNSGGISFAVWSPSTESAANSSVYLNTYALDSNGAGSSVTIPGSFSVDNSGVVTYQALAVPEPSTFALAFIGMGLAGYVGMKRRNMANA